ncbi:unnamed protein product [Caenorhabditis angaria]|uniref:BZIP domain-containing protein n=1 Tax=Caenorhabditis angaria TaxID=860376 RepID=A0A9P1IFS2_9PELO|nr:unnamed protein product [Caenorhabditis angaria]
MTTFASGSKPKNTDSPLMMMMFKALTGEESEDEARRRREQLNRRPSYRMILKDLESSDKVMKKEPDETPPSSVDASPLQVNIPLLPPPQPILINNSSTTSTTSSSRLSTITSSTLASPYGSPIGGGPPVPSNLVNPFVQMNGAQPGDLSKSLDFAAAVLAANSVLGPQQNGLVAGPSSQPQQQQQSSNNMPTSTGQDGPKPIVTMDPSAFSADSPNFGSFNEWQSPLLSGYDSSPSPTGMGGTPNMRIGAGGPMERGHGGEDETNRKRQVRLLKNREAAKECRRKKKEYVKCLENRVSVLENQNKALIEELKTLKELYCRKEKNEM